MPFNTASGLSTPRAEHWSHTVPCKDEDPELMWPQDHAAEQIAEAREVCQACDHIVACLIDGIARRDWDSVRGGYTGPEREQFHRDGLEPGSYPPPPEGSITLPPAYLRLRNCGRCGGSFVPGALRRSARTCPECTIPRPERRGICQGCQEERDLHARDRCGPCYQKTRRGIGELPPVAPPKLRPCGTEAAYNRHRAKGEQPCQVCMDFMHKLWAARRAAKPRRLTVSGAQLADSLGLVRA